MADCKFYRVARPPLNWPQGPCVHWGLAVEDALSGVIRVWHNTPEHGEHWSSLADFAAGLPLTFEAVTIDPLVVFRLQHASSKPRPYDLLMRNCQHTVTETMHGQPVSPTLRTVALVCGAALIVGLAIKHRSQLAAIRVV